MNHEVRKVLSELIEASFDILKNDRRPYRVKGVEFSASEKQYDRYIAAVIVARALLRGDEDSE